MDDKERLATILGAVPLTFDYEGLRSEKLSQYSVVALDLSVARNNVRIQTPGSFFSIMELTSGAVIDIRFNEISNPAITFDSEQQKRCLYYQFFITNAAQAGATVKLYLGQNSEYIPYYRTKAVLPTVDVQVWGTVSVGTSATQILPANPRRRQFTLYNDNDAKYIFIGGSTVTNTGVLKGIGMPPETEKYFTSQPFFVGAMYGASEISATNVIYCYAEE